MDMLVSKYENRIKNFVFQMAEKPIVVKKVKEKLFTNREALLAETSDKILSKKGFVFTSYKTDKERKMYSKQLQFTEEKIQRLNEFIQKNLNNRRDILEYAVKVFKDAGYSNVTIDEPFSADNINCVSTYISKNCSIASLQIEINNKYRYEKSIEFDLEKLSNCFVELIKKITE